MPSSSHRLITADRLGLVVLSLSLALSVSVRIHAYTRAEADPAAFTETEPVDLGDGAFLPREDAVHRTVAPTGCSAPATVDFVDPFPHGVDTSLAAPRDAGDRVYYVYRGRTLHGRFAAVELGVLHFIRLAGAVIRFNGLRGREDRAVKLVVPAGCDASPETLMDQLRRDVKSSG